jgi:hypothetical protein
VPEMSAKQQQVTVAVGAVLGGAAEAHNHSKVQLLKASFCCEPSCQLHTVPLYLMPNQTASP